MLKNIHVFRIKPERVKCVYQLEIFKIQNKMIYADYVTKVTQIPQKKSGWVT